MKTKLPFLFLLVATVLALPLQAQNLKSQEVRGIVTTVVGTSVTIASNKEGEMAFVTDAQTKVLKLDGSAGKLADVVVGATVKITIGNPNEASEIQIVPVKGKSGKKP